MKLGRAFKLLAIIKGLIKNDYERTSGLMAELHGLPQKMGQHLTLYHLNPFGKYFTALCTESRPEDINVEDCLRQLNMDYSNLELRAQASIGQVYKIQTSGQALAVKIKYPGVEDRIKSDFKMLKVLSWPLRLLPFRNSNMLTLLEHLRSMIAQEWDYIGEAERQKLFHGLFKENLNINVPEISTYNDKMIVSQWADGTDLTRSADNVDQWFLETYLAFSMISLRNLGMMHSDPHPGNLLISGEPSNRKLTILDFGSVVIFTSDEALAVRRLLLGDYCREEELVKDLLLLGIESELLEVYRPIIGDLVSILFEPFYYPDDYNFADWRVQYKLNTIMASRVWEKPLVIPYKLLLLMRTIQGFYFYARKGSIVINWHELVKTYLR